jgi:hypothetical protein
MDRTFTFDESDNLSHPFLEGLSYIPGMSNSGEACGKAESLPKCH